MDPDEPVQVPAKQEVAGEVFYPITTDHLKKFGGPLFLGVVIVSLIPENSVPGATKLSILGVMALLGLIMAFLQINHVPFDKWFRIMFKFKTAPKEYVTNLEKATNKKAPPSKNFVRVAGLDQGVIVTQEPSGLARYTIVVKVIPQNFALMRHEEKQSALSVLYSFLAGSEKRIQILSSTTPFDPGSYFQNFLESLRKMPASFRAHTLQYLNWVEWFGKNNGILDREFYVLITDVGPFQKAGRQLMQGDMTRKVKILRGLHSMAGNLCTQMTAVGASCKTLDNKAALELLQNHLNPKSFSKRSRLRELVGLEKAEVVEEASKNKLKIPDIKIAKDYVKVGNDYVRTIQIRLWPDMVPIAWLDEILSMDQRIVLSMHFEPKPSYKVLKALKRAKIALRANIKGKEKKGFDTTEDYQYLQALEEQILRVAARQAQFFETCIFIACHATTRKALDDVTTDVENSIRNLSMTPYVEKLTQQDQFIATLPLGINRNWRLSQTMDTGCATATYPFLTSSIRHDTGNLIGFHRQTNAPYVVDRWKFLNHNRIIAGTSGAGKSFFVKLDMERTLMKRPDAMMFVIDPLREFGDITAALGGQTVVIGNPKTIVNPFQIDVADAEAAEVDDVPAYDKKLTFLETFFRIALKGKIGPREESILMLIIRDLYQQMGITKDPVTHLKAMPTLGDLLRLLQRYGAEHQDLDIKMACKSLSIHMQSLLEGPIGYLNGQTNVALDNNVVTFDLKSLDKDYFTIYMFVVLDYIEGKIVGDITTPKVLYIDEAWYLLEEPATAKVLSQLSRHVRHYRCGMDLITQTPDSFHTNEHASTISANCLQAIFFRQKSVSRQTRETFGLDEREAAILRTLGKAENADYSECIYITGEQKAFLKVYSSREEYQLITTRPEDIEKMQKAEKAKVAAHTEAVEAAQAAKEAAEQGPPAPDDDAMAQPLEEIEREGEPEQAVPA